MIKSIVLLFLMLSLYSCKDGFDNIKKSDSLSIREKQLIDKEKELSEREANLSQAQNNINQISKGIKYMYVVTTTEALYSSGDKKIYASELGSDCRGRWEIEHHYSEIYTIDNYDENVRYFYMDKEEKATKEIPWIQQPATNDNCSLNLKFMMWTYKSESYVFDSYKEASISLHDKVRDINNHSTR